MKRNLYVGGTLEDAAKRVSKAWKRAQRGERVKPEDNVTFSSWTALTAVMTDKRHELLRHLHQHPAASVRALARELGRDYRRVHDDVSALEAVGLLERDADGLRAEYSQIHAVIAL